MNSRFFAQAEVFVAVARCGSITEAAASLRISKSNASQKLLEMEQELDLKLFQRSTRKITLTPAGKALLDKCANAIDIVSEARSQVGVVGRKGEDISGVVALAGSNIYLTEYVLPKLRPFFEKYPNIKLRTVGSDHPVDSLADGIDVRIRVGNVDTAGVKTFPLNSIDRILCIGASASSLAKNIVHPKQLEHLPIILREQEKTDWKFQSKSEFFLLKISDPKIVVNSYELSVQAMRKGYGIAVLARDIIEQDLEKGRVIHLLPDWLIEPLPVTLIVPYSKFAKPHVRALSTYLSEALK